MPNIMIGKEIYPVKFKKFKHKKDNFKALQEERKTYP